MNALGAELVKQVVEPLLVDEDYVERLKGLGGQRGLKFNTSLVKKRGSPPSLDTPLP